MRDLDYFAYGSNLHPPRLRERTPSARVRGKALLRGYRLKLHKRGRDLSAKCDAARTGRREDLVRGVVYRIARGERRLLDRVLRTGRDEGRPPEPRQQLARALGVHRGDLDVVEGRHGAAVHPDSGCLWGGQLTALRVRRKKPMQPEHMPCPRVRPRELA